ncbi:MAG: 2-C-methyl-D-erythritol 4-phosphate cytidylyltransferase [Kiritimatiellae bacterium]|jgi:2-C-methyl-D-erythritol 4-phosphate cytidylyltransferase|nr:2-C-methyl-D-erythritol 4-phosphate cytidylyltransferase [Kiritimatiellia bacterium]
MTTAIILAAGKSSRMGTGVDKAFLSLVNRPVVAWSLMAFERAASVDRIVLVVRKDQIVASKAVAKMFGISKLQAVVAGGTRRQESVAAGLAACEPDTQTVLVHDGARPCVTPELIDEMAAAVRKAPAAAPGRPVSDTLKNCAKGLSVTKTVSRDRLWTVQTPQAFQYQALRDAYRQLDAKTEVTDDCQAAELAGIPVKIVENFAPNFKLTTPADMQLLALLLK